MRPVLTSALLLIGLMPLFASGQWHWLDKSGRPVFSDLPPPPGISDAQIIKRPERSPEVNAPSPSDPQAVANPSQTRPAPSGASLEAAVKQKRAEEERQQARQNAQDAARVAAAKAENCNRARRSLAILNSGSRLKTMNEQGESVFMDDAARRAEQSRIEEVIRSDC